MNFLKDLKVKQKLIFLLSILVGALICVGCIGYYFLNKADQSLLEMYNIRLKSIEYIYSCRTYARKIDSDIYMLMVTSNPAQTQDLRQDIAKNKKDFDTALGAYAQLPMNESCRQKLDNIHAALKQYDAVKQTVISIAADPAPGSNQRAFELYMEKGAPLSNKFNNDLISLASETAQSAHQLAEKNAQTSNIAENLFICIIGASIILAFLIGIMIIRQISSRMADITRCISVLGSGDLTFPITSEHLEDKNEFGEASRAISTLQNNFKNLLRQLNNATDQLAASTQELTASSEQSAQASNQVANSVTSVADSSALQLNLTSETNSIVHQISDAISQVAQNAVSVSGAAEQTAAMASEGEKSINHAIDQMKIIEEKTNNTADVIAALEDRSKQIGQIVDVISGIASQTNLLALNAAIEAARAGEAGKGFAVVAEEVRKLAEQSQNAAKQITSLIEDVQQKTNEAVSFMNDGKNEVHTGTGVVAASGESFTKILQKVKDITEQIRDISASVEEVTGNSQNVVQAVDNIDNESKKASEETQTISAATQEQSASIEEIATASQNLSKMAEELQKSLKKFKI